MIIYTTVSRLPPANDLDSTGSLTTMFVWDHILCHGWLLQIYDLFALCNASLRNLIQKYDVINAYIEDTSHILNLTQVLNQQSTVSHIFSSLFEVSDSTLPTEERGHKLHQYRLHPAKIW